MTRGIWIMVMLAAAGCDPSGRDAFRQGRGYDPCLSVIPACPGQYAACVLDEDNYTEVSFPGELSFMVRCDPEVEIEVMMFFAEQRDAGLSTSIYWNEPGCTDVYIFDSDGRNLLREAEDSMFSESRKMTKGGEHLIRISSDMQVRGDVAIRLIEPGS